MNVRERETIPAGVPVLYIFAADEVCRDAAQLMGDEMRVRTPAADEWLRCAPSANSLMLAEIGFITPALLDHALAHAVSVVALVRDEEELTPAVQLSVDDCLFLPLRCDASRNRLRLQLMIGRLERACQRSPVTLLPGSAWLERVVGRRLTDSLAVLHLDIDHFKAFNDRYGFARGDEVLRAAARLISESTAAHAAGRGMVAHVGGDDFLLACPAAAARPVATAIAAAFDQVAPAWYDAHDRGVGYIEVAGRRGVVERFPLMALSIAIATNEKKKLTGWPQIATLLAELKRYAKSKPGGELGSNWVIDRRGV